jgi:hypothetical protein
MDRKMGGLSNVLVFNSGEEYQTTAPDFNFLSSLQSVQILFLATPSSGKSHSTKTIDRIKARKYSLER